MGKGLSAINHQVWELIDKVERENRLQSRPTLPILVVIGWAGNDVHGDFGYQGCTWIHQTNLTKSEADRKVAAEYVDKQYKKVQRSLDGLVEIQNDPRVLSVQVIGNGDHSGYSLPPSYNREMCKHMNWLSREGSSASVRRCWLRVVSTTTTIFMTTNTTENWFTDSYEAQSRST